MLTPTSLPIFLCSKTSSLSIDLNPEKSIEHELVKVTKCLGANNIKIPDDNVSDVYIYARRQVGLFSLLLAVDAE